MKRRLLAQSTWSPDENRKRLCGIPVRLTGFSQWFVYSLIQGRKLAHKLANQIPGS